MPDWCGVPGVTNDDGALHPLSVDSVTRRDRAWGNGVNRLQTLSRAARASGAMGRFGLKCLRDLRFSIARCHLEEGMSMIFPILAERIWSSVGISLGK